MVSYGDAIADPFGRAGVPRSAPNQLRYVAAATIRREFGLETAKAVLSHSTIIPTQIYAEQYLEAARCAIEKLG